MNDPIIIEDQFKPNNSSDGFDWTQPSEYI